MKKHVLSFIFSLISCLFLHGSKRPDAPSLMDTHAEKNIKLTPYQKNRCDFSLSDSDFLKRVKDTNKTAYKQLFTEIFFDHHKKNKTLSTREFSSYYQLLEFIPNEQERQTLFEDYFEEHNEKNTLDTINTENVHRCFTNSSYTPPFPSLDKIHYTRLCINAHKKNGYKNTQPKGLSYLLQTIPNNDERVINARLYLQHLITNKCFITATEQFSSILPFLPTRQEQELCIQKYCQEHTQKAVLKKISGEDLYKMCSLYPRYVSRCTINYLDQHKENNYTELSMENFYYSMKIFSNNQKVDYCINDFIKNKILLNSIPKDFHCTDQLLSRLQNQQLKNTLAYDCLKKLQKENVFIENKYTVRFIVQLLDNEPLKHLFNSIKENILIDASINTIPQEYQPFQMAYSLTHIDTFTKDVIDLLLINHTKKEDFFYTSNQAVDHCSLVFNELAQFENGGKTALALLTFCAKTKQLFSFEPHHVAQLLELSNLYKGKLNLKNDPVENKTEIKRNKRKLSLQDDTIKNKTEIKRIESECASIALSYLNKIKEKDNKPFITGHNCVVFETLLAVIPQEKWCLFFDESMKEIISNKDFPDHDDKHKSYPKVL